MTERQHYLIGNHGWSLQEIYQELVDEGGSKTKEARRLWRALRLLQKIVAPAKRTEKTNEEKELQSPEA